MGLRLHYRVPCAVVLDDEGLGHHFEFAAFSLGPSALHRLMQKARVRECQGEGEEQPTGTFQVPTACDFFCFFAFVMCINVDVDREFMGECFRALTQIINVLEFQSSGK